MTFGVVRLLLQSAIQNCLEFAETREVSVAELMKLDNGVLFWDVSFFRGVHVRELEALSSFMETIYGHLSTIHNSPHG